MDFEKYKVFMKQNKITYQMLSDKSGIPVGTLKNIFAGYVPHPRIDTVQAIEKALGISDDLWTDEDYKSGVSMTKKLAVTPQEEDVLLALRNACSVCGDKAYKITLAVLNVLKEK